LYDLKKDNAPPPNDLNLIRKDRNIPHNDICAQFVFKRFIKLYSISIKHATRVQAVHKTLFKKINLALEIA